jgi:putative aldouronate transport system substrate-binding protein
MRSILRHACTLALGLAVVAGATAQSADKPVITVANFQMAPTDPNGEMLKYFGDKYGATFKVVNIDNKRYHELLNIKLASGEIPDFLYLYDASTLGNYVKQGVVSPIDEGKFRKLAPNLAKVLDTYAPGYLDMGKVNGKLYGIPVVNAYNMFHSPLVYRADWMKKVGVTKTPETLAEFEALMYKFANTPNLNGDGKKTYGLSADGLTAVFGAFGLAPFDKDTDYWILDKGKITNSSIAPDAKQALELIAKWYKDGVLDPEFITGENTGGYWALSHSFIKGRIGFSTRANFYHWLPAGSFMLTDASGKKVPSEPGANAKEIKAANPNAEWTFGQPLKGPTGKQGIKNWNRLMNFVTIGRLAEKTPGKVDKILQVMDASADPDFVVRNSMKYGTVDKYWKVIDADTETFVFVPPYDTTDTSYWSRIGAMMSLEVPTPPKDTRAQWAFAHNYDKNGIESLIQVGLPQALKYQTELRKIRDSAYISIMTGAKPVSTFDDFVKTWKAAGGDKVLAEADEYYKKN